jgi:hypothetical protein
MALPNMLQFAPFSVCPRAKIVMPILSPPYGVGGKTSFNGSSWISPYLVPGRAYENSPVGYFSEGASLERWINQLVPLVFVNNIYHSPCIIRHKFPYFTLIFRNQYY